MPSASAIKAGEAFIRIFLDKSDLERDLKQVQARLNQFAATAQKAGLALTAIGGATVFGLTRAVNAANEIELTARRLDAVFGDSAESAREFAATLAGEIGASRFEIEKTLTTFKAFFAEIVDSEEQQNQFARRLATLSRDFAAFQGLTPEDALQRFISALSGSPEVLDRFGINLKAAAIDANLAERGIDGTTESVSEFQKVISRLQIIEKTLGSQGAIGKAREELNKFNGRLTQAKAAVLDFLVAVGRPLLTALKPILVAFTTLVKSLTILAETFPVLSIAVGLASVAITAVGLALLGLSAIATLTAGSLIILSKAGKELGITYLQNVVPNIRATIQVSRILNESVLKTAATMAFGKKGLVVYGAVAGRTASLFGNLVAAVKSILSPIGLVIVGVAAVIALIASLLRRLKPIQDSFRFLADLASDIVVGVVARLKSAINSILSLLDRVVNAIPGLATAISFVAKAFSSYFELAAEGLAALKEDFRAITDFLGLTRKTKFEVVAGQAAGPQLSPEEIAARDEQIAQRRKELVERIEDFQIAADQNTTTRAINEIEKKYQREIELAGDAAEEIALLRQAKEQELAALRANLVAQFYRRLQSLDDQIARERASGLADEFARRRREAEISRDAALRAENLTLQEREKINELFAARLENIERDRAASVAEFEKSLDRELFDARSDTVQSRLELELDAIQRKYDEERKQAKLLNADLEAVDRLRRERTDRAIRDEQKRRQEAIDQLNQRRADAEEDLQRQIDRIDIELGSGTDFEKALQRLELERIESLADSDANVDAINELFDKRERLLRQEEAARRLDNQQDFAFGTFSATQIKAVGAGVGQRTREQELLERQLQEAERTNRTLEEIKRGQGATA